MYLIDERVKYSIIYLIIRYLLREERKCYIQIYRRVSIKAYRLLNGLKNKLGLFQK